LWSEGVWDFPFPDKLLCILLSIYVVNYTYILFSLNCAYTCEVVNLCCEVVFLRTLHGCVHWASTSVVICLSQVRILSLIFLCVCLQVNDVCLEPKLVSRIDSMLVDCHWAQMVSYRATRSCSCCHPDHVAALATTSTFYSCDRPCPWAATPGSHQPPDSGKGSGSAAAGLAMSSCAS
jgi:hypothetical protein